METLKIGDYESFKMADELVVQRVLKGEKELFEILLRRYNQTLYRVIRGYLQEEQDVEDAMQDTYLKAYEKLYQFQGKSGFSTWLIRIGINEALLRIRTLKKQSLSAYKTDDYPENIIQLPDSKHINPESQIIHQETRQLLEHAIDQLPEKYKVVYILKEVEGMENDAIASCLELSDSNVKVRLHRAKTILKETLYKISSTADIFEFGNSRCDRIVNYVMNAI